MNFENNKSPEKPTETLDAKEYVKNVVIPAQQEKMSHVDDILSNYKLPLAEGRYEDYKHQLAAEGAQYKLELKEIFAEAIESGEKNPEERKKILDIAQQNADEYLELVHAALAAVKRAQEGQTDTVTPETFAKRLAICRALREWPKDDDNRKAFINAFNGTKLNDQELDLLVAQIQPDELKPEGLQFYSVTSGVLLGLMPPDARYQLTERFMQKHPDQAKGLLDALTNTGLLTVRQGNELAKKHGIPAYDEQRVSEAQEAFQQAADRMVHEMREPSDKSLALRAITFKNIGSVLLVFWGALTAGINTMVNFKAAGWSWKKPWEHVGDALTGTAKSYAPLGAAAVGFGRHFLGFTIPGEKLVTDSSDQEKISLAQKEAGNSLRELLSNRLALKDYLAGGAMKALAKAYEEKKKAREEEEKKYGASKEKPEEYAKKWFVHLEDLSDHPVPRALEERYGRNELEQYLNAVLDLGQRMKDPFQTSNPDYAQEQFNRFEEALKKQELAQK